MICRSKQELIEKEEDSLRKRSIERYSSKATKVESFLLYYVESYMEMLVDKVSEIFSRTESCDFDTISKYVDYPDEVVKHALFRVITTNHQLRKNMFLREDQGIFFLHRDPSSLFHIIRGPILSRSENSHNNRIDKIPMNIHFDNELDYLRSMSVSQKICILERTLCKQKRDSIDKGILKVLRYLFIEMRGKTFHILHYRDLDLSYKAVVPFPSSLNRKTRVLDDGVWKFIGSDVEEYDVVNSMRERYLEKLNSVGEIYSIISVIDNKMRIRRGSEESDRRKTLKGRNLTSIKKEELLSICEFLSINLDHNLKIKEITSKIEEYHIETGNYLMI
ncbi:hypothetical protein K439DRAFT_813521 [Ramaria rubella]|nr:hypothetical protein K439DRAFT_813521 [Ramaria rubella]